jgi:ribosome-associated translation inhibitor RaiA
MKTIETVYSKLNTEKTELATHKVELSIATEIKDALKTSKGLTTSIDKVYDKMQKMVTVYEKLTKSNKDNIKFAQSNIKFIEDTLQKINKMAAELDVDADRVPGYKDLETRRNVLDKMLPIIKNLPELK